jgi:hypothetical protein
MIGCDMTTAVSQSRLHLRLLGWRFMSHCTVAMLAAVRSPHACVHRIALKFPANSASGQVGSVRQTLQRNIGHSTHLAPVLRSKSDTIFNPSGIRK